MSRNAKPRNEKEAEERERALATLARMRRDRLKLKSAAKLLGMQPKRVRRYVGSALRPYGTKENYKATKYDHIPRLLNFPTATGVLALTIRDSRTASRLGEYLNAIRAYMYLADLGPLQSFKKRAFKSSGITYQFVTDVTTLERLGRGGVVVVDGLYRAISEGLF